MSAEVEVVQQDVKVAIAAMVKADPLRRGSEALAAIRETPGIIAVTSDEDAARAGDLRLPLRKAVRHIETGITDLFRPRKMFEELLREHFKAHHVDPMEAAVAQIDRNLLAWDTEKVRRAAAERDAADRVAREQAAAAAAESERITAEAEALRAKAAQTTDNDAVLDLLAQADEMESDAPPMAAVQVIVPEAIRERVQGAEATTFLKRKLVATVEDIRAAMATWPEAFAFDPTACARLYDAAGEERPADNGNKLLGGVRFTVEVSIGGRGR